MMERSRWLTLVMVIFSALALLAFAACGGGDDDDDNGGNSTATATRDGGGDDGGDSTPTDDGGDGNSSDDPFADLDNFSDNLEEVTGKVSYTQSDTDAGGNVSTSTFTIYSKPPNSRWDTGDPDDPSATTILISTTDTTYSCSVSDETCVSFPGGGTGSGLLGGLFSSDVIRGYVAVAEAAGVHVDQSEENIAGGDAACFSWDEDVSNDVTKGKMCFNDAGLMVLLESEEEDGSRSSMRATEYSEDVSDSDFEPPYDVTDLQ